MPVHDRTMLCHPVVPENHIEGIEEIDHREVNSRPEFLNAQIETTLPHYRSSQLSICQLDFHSFTWSIVYPMPLQERLRDVTMCCTRIRQDSARHLCYCPLELHPSGRYESVVQTDSAEALLACGILVYLWAIGVVTPHPRIPPRLHVEQVFLQHMPPLEEGQVNGFPHGDRYCASREAIRTSSFLHFFQKLF